MARMPVTTTAIEAPLTLLRREARATATAIAPMNKIQDSVATILTKLATFIRNEPPNFIPFMD
jgi:hypothetical protein